MGALQPGGSAHIVHGGDQRLCGWMEQRGGERVELFEAKEAHSLGRPFRNEVVMGYGY